MKKLVMVEWFDTASTYDPAWTDKKEITDLGGVPCVTVGLLLNDKGKDIHITLSTNVACFSQAIAIPKGCIKRISKLRVSKALDELGE